ncbi:MAG TPA: hypothetical protein VKK79_07225 [Candidatus Lokiarchaeia archaeon]|nr:hypothetical protein [Candidatus Lokiarchaeia archaeon]
MLLASQVPRVAADAAFTDKTEIRHHQVVFYLVSLENGTGLQVNCSTFFNSTIQMLLFGDRPTDEAIDSSGSYKPGRISQAYASDIGNKPNASITFSANETKIYYIEFVQQDEKTDFLLVYSSQNLTRYYIPFLAGYPLPILLGVVAGALILTWFVRRRYFSQIIVKD